LRLWGASRCQYTYCMSRFFMVCSRWWKRLRA